MAEGRPLPPKLYPGAPARHSLAAAEETEWRKWIPKVGDVVLVELANDQVWPGKVGLSSGAELILDHRASTVLSRSDRHSRNQLLSSQDLRRRH
jgi:hypothetical protein